MLCNKLLLALPLPKSNYVLSLNNYSGISDLQILFRFHIDAKTNNGTITIPQKTGTNLLLDGRDAKIITTSYEFGSQHLLYSTSEIFTHFSQDSQDVMLVYAYEGEDGEFAITSSSDKISVNGTNAGVTSALNGTTLQINYQHPNGTTYINAAGQKGKDVLLVVAGYDAATKWWAPVTSSGKTVMIQGPYLVRSAEIQGTRLAFTGDTESTTSIEIVASKEIRSVTWNGINISVKRTSYGTLTGKISGPVKINLPDLTKSTWKYSPASPETNTTFDDSKWVNADHMTTNNPKLTPTTLPVLYADDYGYHFGSLWFRGSFNATSEITGLSVNATMGSGSAWVAWLNGQYLGGITQDSYTFKLNSSDLQSGKENVLSLLMWTTGHEEEGSNGDEFKTPRGFSGVALEGAENTTITWKVQGNLGGEHIVDTTRGPYNEGGLYGERNGWHLPGYPDNGWKSVSLPESTPRSGVSWYRTTFELNIPKEHDVPLGIKFHNSTSERYRSLLFINGWQFGKYANDLGPQSLYYVPEGILNHNGQNTIAVGVIAIDESVSLASITIETYGALRSAKPPVSLVESPTYSQLKSHYH
ncbi:hypothetical protein INT43_003728 [Umbelopsis isabellina]|uniref:beta-galactosidase n=1 Tax=Mortierella isabellina TaxID=91625 RepID=A0A8H7PVF3_MORIS|nr:hypothetical protein INT43_003728 [Umbelopsis isabellina]